MGFNTSLAFIWALPLVNKLNAYMFMLIKYSLNPMS